MELYPVALDYGISIETFWDSSLNEILDMIESAAREEKRRRKEKIVDDFVIAEVTAMNIASMLFPDKKLRLPKPWDYYDRLFKEEKAVFEEKDQDRRF